MPRPTTTTTTTGKVFCVRDPLRALRPSSISRARACLSLTFTPFSTPINPSSSDANASMMMTTMSALFYTLECVWARAEKNGQ